MEANHDRLDAPVRPLLISDGPVNSMHKTIEAIDAAIRRLGGEVTIPDRAFVEMPAQPGWEVASGGRVLVEEGASIGPDLKLVVSGPGCVAVLCAGSEFRKGAEIRVEGRGSWAFIGGKVRLGPCKIFVKGRECGAALGEGLTWEGGAALCYREAQAIILGDDCMLSNDVRLRTEDGHGIFDTASRERLNPAEPVVIGPHVWIGHGATVNKGTRIGRGAVLGTKALANGTLEGHAIHAGVPARTLREGVTWSRSDKWSDIPEAYWGSPQAEPAEPVPEPDFAASVLEAMAAGPAQSAERRDEIPVFADGEKAGQSPFWKRWRG